MSLEERAAPSLSQPLVSLVVEASNWDDAGHITLEHTLRALSRQTYPQERRECLIVLPSDRWERGKALADRFPGTRTLLARPGLSYYQLKELGAGQARGELIAFVDSDNLVSRHWLEELLEPFARDPRVIAVVGRTTYRRAFLSRMLDALIWVRAFDDEGPVDRVYLANNLAVRRAFLDGHAVGDDSSYRGLWERVMTERARSMGATIWLNPRATLVHDYAPSRLGRLGLARGYTLLAIRLDRPTRTGSPLTRVAWLAPWPLFAGLIVKDVWRILSRVPRGESGWQTVWRVPLYVLACVPFDVLALAGMIRAVVDRRTRSRS